MEADKRTSLSVQPHDDQLSNCSSDEDIQQRRSTDCWQRWTWFLPAFIVFYSFVKEIKVGEPFLFKYQTEYLNLTRDELKGEIYIYMPYTYLIALVPIFLLTDLFLYKPTMLVEILGQIGFRSALVFGHSVFSQILGVISYGIASASEVAFFSYIYARLEKDQYQRLTSWTRAGTMGGRTLGYVASQMIILTQIGNYRTLNIIAFVFPCVVLIFCLCMPKVHWKKLVARMAEAKAARIINSKNPKKEIKVPQTYTEYLAKRIRTLHSDFVKIYSSSTILKWSIWWALTNCMHLQFALLSQTLWGEVQKPDSNNIPMNGFAEASYTLTAAVSILAMNTFTINWQKWGEATLVVISTIDAIILVVYARTQSIWIMYGCYIVYRSLFQVMITIAQFNIARAMICESYGVVFGCNTLISLILQSVLTLVVTDQNGPLAMNIRDQYLLYGICHAVIATIFFVAVIYSIACYLTRRPKISDKTRSQIFMVSHASLTHDEEVLKKEDLRNAIDVVEEESDQNASSTSTSDTEEKSDTNNNV